MSLIGLEMVIVTTKTTIKAAISMAVIVVDQMLTRNIVHNVFVINKCRMIIHVAIASEVDNSCSN